MPSCQGVESRSEMKESMILRVEVVDSSSGVLFSELCCGDAIRARPGYVPDGLLPNINQV